MADAVYIRSDREYAGCFRLEGYMKMKVSVIFLQINECAKQNRTKVKIKKWLGIPNLAAYENYINTWHYFLKNMKAFLEEQDNEEMSKKINVYILKIFFEEPYNNEDFYTQFEKRMQKMQQIF